MQRATRVRLTTDCRELCRQSLADVVRHGVRLPVGPVVCKSCGWNSWDGLDLAAARLTLQHPPSIKLQCLAKRVPSGVKHSRLVTDKLSDD